MRLRTLKDGKVTKCLAMLLCLFLAMPLFTVPSAMAAPGDITNNSGLIPFQQPFFAFEVEDPLDSLKGEPIWDEIEQMLDNPYAFVYEPNVAPNYQGYPSYRSTIPRRRSFVFRLNGDTSPAGVPCAPGTPNCVEVPHSGFLVHPLNYTHTGGEECRLLNINFPEMGWVVPDRLNIVTMENTDSNLGPLGVPVVQWTYRDITVTPGIDRIEEDEAAVDLNSPHAPDTETCIVSTEAIIVDGVNLGEGIIVCGGDPGEPNYFGFGVLDNPNNPQGYSTPCVPLPAGSTVATVLNPAVHRLYDPVRGFIGVRDPVTGGLDPLYPGTTGLLRKPSLRIAEVGGTGTQPNYVYNSNAQLEARALAAGDDPEENAPAYLAPSNENDYIQGTTRAEKQAARNVAAALGKALFWDMQVGSDSVQACGSCHFHAGADNRTKNQLNPNHLSGDFTFQVAGSNMEVVPSHFPFHKLADVRKPGEPLVNPENVISDANDVMSSMGVRFGEFSNIPTPGPRAFSRASNGVSTLLPDRRGSGNDPIPGFRGLRRVEPRNTPTFFSTALNFDNFWDGRARHDFNGGSVFGASDPQAHVMVDMGDGNIQATRQIIRFSSLASLATGPALSNFEMSFDGRNWAKIGKKLLQPGVVPLANQLVDPNDSVLGPYSGQRETVGGPVDRPGRPGLNVSYNFLIRQAFYPALWQNTTMHLNGCYTDGRNPKCAPGSVSIPVFDPITRTVVNSSADPFDNYVLSIAPGPADPLNTNQFTQMEANMPLFFGLSIQTWGHILVPDDTPFDRFMDANPDAFKSFGESGEPFLVLDLLNCFGENGTNGVQSCFTEVGNFKRDSAAVSPTLNVRLNCTLEGGEDCQLVPSHGTRQPGAPDPLLGLDFFLGSNFSLKNANFRSFRCGECHASGTLTDATFGVSHQVSFIDWVPEFVQPGLELFPEPLGRGRVISGFFLEGELQENAQDGIERNIADMCVVEPCVDVYGNPIPGGVAGGFPQGQALFDNGMYNIGVRPIAEDLGRGGNDPFGWPLSLSYLALMNLGGVDYHPGGNNSADNFAQPPNGGIPLPNFDPAIDPTGGGLFEPTAQDQQINPGFGEEPAEPQLPPYLAPWASNIPVGDEINIDEVFIGLNTLMYEPMLEGFTDSFGPFNPAGVLGEVMNSARGPEMATWPNVNRVNAQGAFKAPPLRNVELTGPYFHTGSKLTLRQELDFYIRGGDFPVTNKAHRDFLIVNLSLEDEALGGCVDPTIVPPGMPPTSVPCSQAGAVPEFTPEQKEVIFNAMIDFLLELTDERVKFERAPFDHPELFVPLDGKAPDNTFGRSGFLTRLGMFRQVPAVGAGGNLTPLPNFLGIASRPTPGKISHFDSFSIPAQLTLIAPNGDEVFSPGNPISISWDGGPAGAKFYRLEYSADDGANWKVLSFSARRIPATNKSFTWTFPRTAPFNLVNVKVRVTALNSDGAAIAADISDAPFRIIR